MNRERLGWRSGHVRLPTDWGKVRTGGPSYGVSSYTKTVASLGGSGYNLVVTGVQYLGTVREKFQDRLVEAVPTEGAGNADFPQASPRS